jgi:hypothetical protein
MRLFYAVLFLTLCLVLSGTTLVSQVTQTPKANVKALTNADVLDMLSGGLSQEIVIAKIAASSCEFDTSPAALKVLKAASVSDAVILAMVQAPTGSRRQDVTDAEPTAPAQVDCKHSDPVPVFSVPRTQTLNNSGSDSVEVFRLKCGDGIKVLNSASNQGWLKIRASDGQVGYISFALVKYVASDQQGHANSESKKREDTQKANDNLEDCRARSQNEYSTKMDALNTMALAPMVRVAAASRLRQNLDAELRQCRSQYELRLKAIDGE